MRNTTVRYLNSTAVTLDVFVETVREAVHQSEAGKLGLLV